MSRIDRTTYRHRDIPQIECINFAASNAGTGTDYEHALAVIPDLTKLTNLPSGVKGSMPLNAMQIREAILNWEAAITGANTNFFTLNINQYRGAAVLVNTTVTVGATGTGLQTVTPASITNIFNGMQLNFTGGTPEIVTVFNVNVAAGTFQAVFANSHASASAIKSVPIATISYVSGTNAALLTPVYLTITPHYLLPGDLVTVQRVSTGTGLASPAGFVEIDWVNYGNAI